AHIYSYSLLFLPALRPPTSTLFPYTTLFRSDRRDDFRTEVLGLVKAQMVKNALIVPTGAKGGFFPKQLPPMSDRDAWMAAAAWRSEEHTSELQSRFDLVCRLLLEKKKT